MIRKLLIANRGEIACRIVRTCRKLGIRTVAVFSEADRGALHVRMADEAVAIGPPAPAESYLAIPKLLDAARRSGADAIHPGYGFLAESAAFARAVRDAGLVFVGPSPEAMEKLGAKDRAKALAEAAGVPVVPGYRGADQNDARLLAEARRIGFPLLLKAVAGGGGRGMRRVDRLEDFESALAACRREAAAAFGDDRLLLERLVERPRHVEVQVVADRAGRVVHLFERECTLQRRHQKLLEEAPAPGLPETLRRALGEAAVRLARAAGYENAGTIEFLVDPEGRFYFIEANTRLQVEHPVTEEITGFDLVEWQLRIAEGRPLPVGAEDVAVRGHAIEVRLYAEDPAKGFLPSSGRLARLVLPFGAEGVRIETGVAEGDVVGTFYDPMIAKVIARGHDRESALARLREALAVTEVEGPVTNLAFLARLLREPAIREAAIDTEWLDREGPRLAAAVDEPEPIELVAAAFLCARAERARAEAAAGPWKTSPWIGLEGFRPGRPPSRSVHLEVDGRARVVRLDGPPHALEAFVDGERLGEFAVAIEDDRIAVESGGRRFRLHALVFPERVILAREGRRVVLRRPQPWAPGSEEIGGEGLIASPMPGRIVRLPVEPGARVVKGQLLAVLEAMKMEHRLTAPRDGRVAAVHVAEGEQVEEGTILLDLAPPDGPESLGERPARAPIERSEAQG
ncbi:MAG: biotin carboxylase N-terminal domain-containing protein [Geminicoccaceae bacterium]|nr:biotin carboxylase N-terminal domain-containing protein [Geminicoccaceae bacterium]